MNPQDLRNLIAKTDLPREVEELSHAVIGAAIEVHRYLGPGLIENIYEQALTHELASRGIRTERQVPVRIPYKEIVIEGQRVDLIVDRTIIVELKSVSEIHEVFKAKLLSYLRAAELPLGLLINFNAVVLKGSIHRILNERALSRAMSSSRSS